MTFAFSPAGCCCDTSVCKGFCSSGFFKTCLRLRINGVTNGSDDATSCCHCVEYFAQDIEAGYVSSGGTGTDFYCLFSANLCIENSDIMMPCNMLGDLFFKFHYDAEGNVLLTAWIGTSNESTVYDKWQFAVGATTINCDSLTGITLTLLESPDARIGRHCDFSASSIEIIAAFINDPCPISPVEECGTPLQCANAFYLEPPNYLPFSWEIEIESAPANGVYSNCADLIAVYALTTSQCLDGEDCICKGTFSCSIPPVVPTSNNYPFHTAFGAVDVLNCYYCYHDVIGTVPKASVRPNCVPILGGDTQCVFLTIALFLTATGFQALVWHATSCPEGFGFSAAGFSAARYALTLSDLPRCVEDEYTLNKVEEMEDSAGFPACSTPYPDTILVRPIF